MVSSAFKLTLRLQPVIVIYTFVSICSKLASRQLPSYDRTQSPATYLLGCLSNWRLLFLTALMVGMLGIYAFFWQRAIKNGKMAVIYANKAASVFWGQLAAVFLFSERLGWFNIFGILLVFGGIFLANTEQEDT